MSTVIKLAIVGSRNFTDYYRMIVFLEKCLDKWGINGWEEIEIVSGGALGADALAEQLALEHKLTMKIFPAHWKQFGPRAGPIRNSQIVEYCTHIAAFPSRNGRGTQDTIQKGLAAGKLVEVMYVD